MSYERLSARACVVSSLVDYFLNSMSSRHYAISPSLRHAVGETEEEAKSQWEGRVPVFLVIEEFNSLTPVEMIKGECKIVPEVAVRGDEKIPILVGGREGEEFIIAWAAVGGAWPELPNNEHVVNMVLAGVRAGQQETNPIRKCMDQKCLVTDDGRFVEMMRPTMSTARVRTARAMDTTAFRARVSEIRRAIAAMDQDIYAPHMALLVNSMYSDEYKDDSFQLLQYLQLWQSLADAAKRSLGYQGDVRDDVVVAGQRTLRELTEYRHDIAHWWTDTMDGNFLADLQRTINELLRRKYF